MKYFEDLMQVVSVACCCMMGVITLGVWNDAINPKPKQIRYVECSVTIQHMAAKFNVTLLNECEVYD